MRPAPLIAQVLGGVGLATSVAGTFLPWLTSGTVDRSSYASFGVLRRLVGFHGVAAWLVRFWPALALAYAVVVVVAIAGFVRSAAALGFVLASWAAAVSSAALTSAPMAGVRVYALGPVVTATGSAMVMLAVILTLVSPAHRRIRHGKGS